MFLTSSIDTIQIKKTNDQFGNFKKEKNTLKKMLKINVHTYIEFKGDRKKACFKESAEKD